MATQTCYHITTTGQTTLYAFPFSQSLANWEEHRVLLEEVDAADDPERYSADLDDSLGVDWAIFDGDSAPVGWNSLVGSITLSPPVHVTPFLDETPPKDWILALTDRSLGDEVDRVIEAKPGELLFIAVDCRVIMATGQTNLFRFDLPDAASGFLSIVPTSDPANPQWGKAGRLVKFQVQVADDATLGTTGYVDLSIWASSRSNVLPRVAIKIQ